MTKQTTRKQAAVLLLLLLLLAALHAPRLAAQSYWADECYTIGLTQLTLPQLAEKLSTDDAHPPLHDLLLTWAVKLFGTSAFVVQGVSLLALVLLGVLGVTWVRRRFGFRCAVTFLLLLLCTRSMIDYATEVRMYAWSALLVTLCMAFAYELMHRDHTVLWVGLVGMAVASAYAHYYALVAVAFVFLGLFVYRVWVLPCATNAQPRPSCGVRSVWRFVLAGLACVAGYAPWLSILLRQLNDGMENWWMTTMPPLQSFLLFVFGWQATGYVLFALVVGLFVAYFLAAARVSCCCSLTDDGTRQFAWDKMALLCNPNAFFVIWGILVSGGMLCVGLCVSYLMRPTFLERYLFPAAGILLLVLAVAVSQLTLRRKTVAVLAAVLVLTGALNYVMVWRDEATFERNTAQALAQIAPQLSAGDTLVSDSDHLYWAALPYYFPQAKASAHDAIDWDSLPDGATVWLFDTGSMLQSGLTQQLARAGRTVREIGRYTLHWYAFTLYAVE